MSLSPNDFYIKHIQEPAVHLEECETEASIANNTYPLREKKHDYGSSFYQNPHKHVGEEKDYYIRCLERMARAIKCKNTHKIFFYQDSSENKMTSSLHQTATTISDILENKVAGSHEIVVARAISDEKQILPEAKNQRVNSKSQISLIKYNSIMMTENAKAWHELNGRILFPNHKYHRQNLWTP